MQRGDRDITESCVLHERKGGVPWAVCNDVPCPVAGSSTPPCVRVALAASNVQRNRRRTPWRRFCVGERSNCSLRPSRPRRSAQADSQAGASRAAAQQERGGISMPVSRPQATQAGRFLWTVTAPHPVQPRARMALAEGDGSQGRAEPRPGRAREGVTAPCNQPRLGTAGPSPRETAAPSVSLAAPGFAADTGRFQQRARARQGRSGATRGLHCLCRGQ